MSSFKLVHEAFNYFSWNTFIRGSVMQKRKIKNSIKWDCLSILNPLRNKLLMYKKRPKNTINIDFGK